MTERPLVSIITPTRNRENFLARALQHFLAQDYGNTEWLVLDDSDQPSRILARDQLPSIIYGHLGRRLTIGEKRNLLVEKARGEIIVQFDDDDFYGQQYVSRMVGSLQSLDADLINLRGWYLHDLRSGFFGYWDLMKKTGLHYCCDANGVSPLWFDEGNNQGFENNHLGFGFSFAFRRQVWRASPFPHIDWNEDGEFAIAASARFKLDGIRDEENICLHVLHPQSSSRCFPQYQLPGHLLDRLYPGSSRTTTAGPGTA